MQPRVLVHDHNGMTVFRNVELSSLQWLEMATQAAFGIVAETAARHAYWEAGGCDGNNPYDETKAALAQLYRALQETEGALGILAGHAHEWNEHDYCRICGTDGRA